MNRPTRAYRDPAPSKQTGTPRSPTASVVIPAHDEADVLGRCLSTLLRGAEAGELDVVVVANACTDTTADVARDHGVRVIETDTPGKANALRLGDEVALAFPRIYLDADVDLTVSSVRALRIALTEPGVLAASPIPQFDVTGVRRSARRILQVHELMMEGRRGLAGAGVYCLNESGHARVAPFPDVISDDGFVHRSFAPGERVVVRPASSVVRPAPTFRATLRRRVRVRQGNRQLDALGLPLPEGRLALPRLGELVRARRISTLDAGWYLGLMGVDRTQVWWQAVRGREAQWGTDRSSRRTPTVAGSRRLPRGG